jgi:hypothetical protein
VPLVFHSGREADHSPPSSAEVKEWLELYLHSPMHLHGVVLSWGEHSNNYNFTFTRGKTRVNEAGSREDDAIHAEKRCV